MVGLLLLGSAIAQVATAATSSRDKGAKWGRAGNVAGLEGGLISMAKVSKMMTSSVDVEVGEFFTYSSSPMVGSQ